MHTTARQLGWDLLAFCIGCGFLAALVLMIVAGLLTLLWESLTWIPESK